MDNTYEIGRGGSLSTITIKDHQYDVVEFTITKYFKDEKGVELTNSGYTTFFSSKEFTEFFTPIVNDLKARLDNANHASNTNT
jgi:expansin (peptidoglycan-binding protein)